MKSVSVLGVIGLGMSLVACVEPDVVESDVVEDGVPVAREEIARVRMGEGEITYFELVDGSVAVRDTTLRGVLSNDERSPLEMYLAITPPSAAVPRALLEIETSPEIVAGAGARTIVHRVPITTTAVIGDIVSPTPIEAAGNYCAGTTSQSWLDEICTLTNWDVNFCHNGTWYSVSDEVGSSNKKHSSRSVTLGCGANGRVRHNYWFWGVKYNPIDETTPSGQVTQWTHYGGTSLERQIVHSRTTDSSFVRASSHFNH